MPFSRRALALRPIKTDKHEVVWTTLSQDLAPAVATQIVIGVQSADKDASTEVEVGSHVKFIYFEFMLNAEVITNAKVVDWIVIFRPQNVSSAAQTPTLFYQNGRNLILRRGREMLPKSNTTTYKRIIGVRIPRKYQRIGESDTINITFGSSSSEAINLCGFAIYKEFY